MARLSASLASALLAALGVIQPVSTPGPWARLHRPLHLPTVAPGAACPVSGVGRINFARYGVGRGIGPGPAYPIGFAQPGSALQFTYPPDPASEFAGSLWSGQKVLWFVAHATGGRCLSVAADSIIPAGFGLTEGRFRRSKCGSRRGTGHAIVRLTHGFGRRAATRIRSTAPPSAA
jgi:hypothetical protein